jgi:lactoylglutathione lyase
MKKVTGIGGVFFKVNDPKAMKEWYRNHLGIDAGNYGASFEWREKENPELIGSTSWSLFPHDTKYFLPSTAPFMINYRVADLDSLIDQFRKDGVSIEGAVQEFEYGRFAYIMDPEGNRIELWEPPKEK